MAIRKIREMGDPVLYKRSKEVTDITPRIRDLIDDMFETLYEAEGVGLAAPQVGILKRIVVIDTTGEDPILLINPKLMETSGEQEGYEGCLSVPGVYGYVKRPEHVKVRAQDRNGKWFEVEGFGLTARAMCHELAHLEGQLFTEVSEHIMSDEELDDYYGRDVSSEIHGRER